MNGTPNRTAEAALVIPNPWGREKEPKAHTDRWATAGPSAHGTGRGGRPGLPENGLSVSAMAGEQGFF